MEPKIGIIQPERQEELDSAKELGITRITNNFPNLICHQYMSRWPYVEGLIAKILNVPPEDIQEINEKFDAFRRLENFIFQNVDPKFWKEYQEIEDNVWNVMNEKCAG